MTLGSCANYVFSAEARQQGIFGVPLRQSITYANVAISLVDDNGQSYIYGYVPIVVAKCGVFLKEKGKIPAILDHQTASIDLQSLCNSHWYRGYISPQRVGKTHQRVKGGIRLT